MVFMNFFSTKRGFDRGLHNSYNSPLNCSKVRTNLPVESMNKTFFLVLVMIAAMALSGRVMAAEGTLVNLETDLGSITIELFDEEAPITVNNYLGYVDKGFYDGLIFHRILEGFMIQGGAYDPNLYDYDFSGPDPNLFDPIYFHEPNDPIILEASIERKNLRGRIAMARTTDPNSANAQFFINQVDNPFLDPSETTAGYAVFGKVVKGLSVVDRIAGERIIDDPNVTDDFEALPVVPVIMTEVGRVQQDLFLYDPCFAVYDPCFTSLRAITDTNVSVPIRLRNIGDEGTFDPCDPEQDYEVTLYISEDPCALPGDPDFVPIDEVVHSLTAPGTSDSVSVSFTAPHEAGDYYLSAVADDGTVAMEFENLNRWSVTVPLTVELEPCDITITNFIGRAGLDSNSDSFLVIGYFAGGQADFSQSDVEVTVGPYSEALSQEDFLALGGDLYFYRGGLGRIGLALFNFRLGMFIIQAVNVDLTGLTDPVEVEFIFGRYRGLGEASGGVINGGAGLSLRFLQGQRDALRKSRFVYVDNSNDPYNSYYSVKISGEIATQSDISVFEEPSNVFTVKWGSTEFTADMGDFSMFSEGRFLLLEPLRDLALAYFDFKSGTFNIFITKSFLAAPKQVLTIKFEDDQENVLFEQAVDIQ